MISAELVLPCGGGKHVGTTHHQNIKGGVCDTASSSRGGWSRSGHTMVSQDRLLIKSKAWVGVTAAAGIS